jgi:hypothetical protein
MSDNKFKVGDTVRRTSQGFRGVTQGGVYEVTSVDRWYIYFLGDSGLKVTAIGDYFELVTTDNNRNNLEATAMNTSKFTETVTTTKTTIKEVIDGSLSNGALVSTAYYPEAGVIYLVVGAKHSSEYKAQFDKSALQELINDLQAVHDVMECN